MAAYHVVIANFWVTLKEVVIQKLELKAVVDSQHLTLPSKQGLWDQRIHYSRSCWPQQQHCLEAVQEVVPDACLVDMHIGDDSDVT